MTTYLEQRYLDNLCTTFYYMLADQIWERWGGKKLNSSTEQAILTFIRDEEGATEDRYEQRLLPARVFVQDDRIMIEPRGFHPYTLPAAVPTTDEAIVNDIVNTDPAPKPLTAFQRWIRGV